MKARQIKERERTSYAPVKSAQWSLWTSSQDHLLNQSSMEKHLTFPWPSFLNFLSGLERGCPGNSEWNLKILSPGFINIRNANEVRSSRPSEWNISFRLGGTSRVETHLWRQAGRPRRGQIDHLPQGWSQHFSSVLYPKFLFKISLINSELQRKCPQSRSLYLCLISTSLPGIPI